MEEKQTNPYLLKVRNKEKGWTRARAAEMLGVSAMTVGRWMAEAFPELPRPRQGRREGTEQKSALPAHPPGDNYRAADIEGRAVPLVDEVPGGPWGDIADPYQIGRGKRNVMCPVPCGPNTLALRVSGRSMYNPGSKPSFEDGDIIFVDPDLAAKPGDLVVARQGQDKATFKQYIEESDGRKYLWALNPDFPNRVVEATEETVICGVVLPAKISSW